MKSHIYQLSKMPRLLDTPYKIDEIGWMIKHCNPGVKILDRLFVCISFNQKKYDPESTEYKEDFFSFSIMRSGLKTQSKQILHDEIFFSYPAEIENFFNFSTPPGGCEKYLLRISDNFLKTTAAIREKLNNIIIPGTADLLDQLALQLITECRIAAKTENPDVSWPDMRIHKLANDLKNGIPLSELIKKYSFSRRGFYLAWSKVYDISPVQFKLQENLQQAALLLRRSHLTITEIAAQCNFSSSIYFYRQFKKQFKCTPQQYRDNT